MLCNICHKSEATVHFQGVVNDQVFKVDMCGECAKNKGFEIKPDFVIPEILSTLAIQGSKEKKSIECSSCGLKYSEFKQTGRLGCANCYTSFNTYLEPLIKKIHGAGKYKDNKFCQAVEQQKHELKHKNVVLKKKLDEAIKKEQYEFAAEINRQIKETENGK